MLKGQNILLGITGSIAAYKSAVLTRLLVKAGANVKVVMTPAAKEFITPLTLSTLSKNPVHSEFTHGNQGEWTNHVDLANWANIILIAPATADIIAKMANGICDNLLLAVYLSSPTRATSSTWGKAGMGCVFIAPAMDLDMYQHPSTKANLKKLQSYGNTIIPPDTGELASGLTGEGRMAEPEAIVQFLSEQLKKKLPLSGRKALVTAGPTYEAIDPVRFIGNHSSGKMGFAIAEALAGQGADVTLVCGPNSLSTGRNMKRVDVITADEMHKACLAAFPNCDIAVMVAAVADFKPTRSVSSKIKKENGLSEIKLSPTKDILADLGKRKKGTLLVGFALETDNGVENAKKKLRNKNLDMIVLNSLGDERSGFGHDTNKITIIDKRSLRKFDLMSKNGAAEIIVSDITTRLSKK